MPRGKNSYRMNTKVFVVLWQNNLKAYHLDVAGSETQRGNWRNFCITLFERMYELNQAYDFGFKPYTRGTKGKAGKLNEDAAYQFISEKAYAKCQSIRRNQFKDVPGAVLPAGYLSRPGAKGSRRKIDWAELGKGFE